MQNDNVASSQFPGLRELGVEPTPVDAVLDEVGRELVAHVFASSPSRTASDNTAETWGGNGDDPSGS
jgi:hypothetical protein